MSFKPGQFHSTRPASDVTAETTDKRMVSGSDAWMPWRCSELMGEALGDWNSERQAVWMNDASKKWE